MIPRFADTLLAALTRDGIVTWLKSVDTGRTKPLSNKRLANIQTVLRQALTASVDKKLTDTNPLIGYTYSRKLLAISGSANP